MSLDAAGPARDRLAPLVPAIAAAASLAVYGLTLVREVDWGDGAELSLQAFQLGVTHAPGYPVHTFLGKLFGLFIPDPALATNLLSAICTSVAVGLLAWTALRLTGNRPAGLAAAMAFGLSPFVWEKAVVTEVYNVNGCFVALAVALILVWFRKPSWGVLAAAAVVFGLSLGTYLANLLFLPAFMFMVLHRSPPRRWRMAAAFLLIVASVGIILLSWSYFRSRVIVPPGTLYIPNTLGGFLRYLRGAQYGTTVVQSPGFYLQRAVEHTIRFTKNLLGIGVILGLIGFWRLWREQRGMCIGLLIIFAINFGYFTSYQAPDYAYMVTPAYLVFSLWIAGGLAYLLKQRRVAYRAIGVVAAIALLGGLFIWKLPVRVARSRSMQVTEFASSSFEVLPENAVVIAAWRRFAPLLYFQRTRGLRPDLTLIERHEQTRYYAHGAVSGWQDFAASLPPSTPVFIDRIETGSQSVQQVSSIGDTWHQITVEAASK
ncbi:MAG TPA: DUF2723 domain-containing protein [Anaerolineae bacterium]|nr:DUF2723 domain-containing protein [Anaerolineae bacterium]